MNNSKKEMWPPESLGTTTLIYLFYTQKLFEKYVFMLFRISAISVEQKIETCELQVFLLTSHRI